jgi:AcrR family transcriptional regulator
MLVRPRPGRPRNEDCDRAIERAALALLVEEGFAGMTIEGIAARAGVGKATLYRRWHSKAALVVDAVHRQCLEHVATPDTGDVRADLTEVLRVLVRRFQRDGEVMQAFAAERGRHPELAETFRTLFLAERRAATQAIVQRGIDRGQLAPTTDVELLADAGPALLWHRFSVIGAPIDDLLPERIVAQLLPASPKA